MMTKYRILILGSSYGILPATKFALAGHPTALVGRPEEIAQISETGTTLHVPARGTELPLVINLPAAEGATSDCRLLGLVTPESACPDDYDLFVLAMQEPQYSAPEVADLIKRIGQSRRPCLALMNIPPAPFMKRLPGVDADSLSAAYSSWKVWSALDPRLITVASPDAQAVRLNPSSPGCVHVTLASNFKVAPFADPNHQKILHQLASDVDAIRVPSADGSASVVPRVRFVAHQSIHIPLAKWPMLIAGNSRCLRNDEEPVSIRDAVWSSPERSRQIYDSINSLALAVGANEDDLVSFDRYAEAAKQLTRPSSLARALHNGANKVERVDLLMLMIARSLGIANEALEQVVSAIENKLLSNINRS